MKNVTIGNSDINAGYSEDVTAQLQQIIDKGSDLIEIPAGTYNISAPLVMLSGQQLKLANDAVIKLDEAATACCLLTANKNSTNISVDGGTWDAGFAADCSAVFCFDSGQDISLTNVTLKDAGNSAICLEQVDKFKLENITFANRRTGKGAAVLIQQNCKNGSIKSVSTTSQDSAFSCLIDCAGGNLTNINIDGVTFEDADSVIRLCGEKGEINSMRIKNIQGRCRGAAIQLDNGDSTETDDNIHNILIADIELARSIDNREPVILIKANGSNIMMTKIKRDDENVNAPTLVIDNQTFNLFTLKGISGQQLERVNAESDNCQILEDIEPEELFSVTTNVDSVFKLPAGGFEEFILNHSGPMNLCCNCQCGQ